MSEVSERERDMLRHALGWRQSDISYRNHYAAGDDDVAVWEDLVERGLAVRCYAGHCPDPVFAATHAGAMAVIEEGEGFRDDITLPKAPERHGPGNPSPDIR